MRTLKLHFTRNKDGKIFSRLLQWYENLPISHVAVQLQTSKALGQNFVLHSVMGHGVSLISKDRFLKDNEIMETYTLELEVNEYKSIRNAMLADCGEDYAMMQNIGIFIVDMLRKINIMSDNPFKDGQNCSELVYRHLIPEEYKSDNISPDLIKPSQIRSILLENGYTPSFTRLKS